MQPDQHTQPNTPIKRCPGIKGMPCGNARGKGGYCDDCRRRYQRDRYKQVRTQAGLVYDAREATRTKGHKPCDCCDVYKESGLLRMPSGAHVCDTCLAAVEHLVTALGGRATYRVVQFVVEHPQDFAINVKYHKSRPISLDEAFDLLYGEEVKKRTKEFGYQTADAFEADHGRELQDTIVFNMMKPEFELPKSIRTDRAPWMFEDNYVPTNTLRAWRPEAYTRKVLEERGYASVLTDFPPSEHGSMLIMISRRGLAHLPAPMQETEVEYIGEPTEKLESFSSTPYVFQKTGPPPSTPR